MYETKYLKIGYVQDVKVVLTLTYPLFKLTFDTTGLCCNKIVTKLTTQSCSSIIISCMTVLILFKQSCSPIKIVTSC